MKRNNQASKQKDSRPEQDNAEERRARRWSLWAWRLYRGFKQPQPEAE